MNSNTQTRAPSDSFQDTLNSEMVSGTESLNAWLKHLEGRGAIDLLFQMECWIKGLLSFFDIRHLPMSLTERSDILKRSFGPELRILHDALQRSERLASEIVNLGQPTQVEFETFIEAQLRKDNALDYHISTILEQATPLDSLVRLLDSLNDIRVLLGSMKDSAQQDYQVYLSLGRCFHHELKNCRYVDMLLSQRFRPQYDRMDRPVLSALLRGIPEDRLRRNVALAFLYLFRLLRYLSLIQADLVRDHLMRPSLVLFALVHKEADSFSEFLRSRFIKGREAGQKGVQAAELIVYSLKVESQRTIERELVSVACEGDARVIFTKVEDSHGLLCNCLQSGVVTLARAFDAAFDARAFFPSMIESVEKSQKLRQDLWSLRHFMKQALDQGGHPALESLIERLSAFRETSMRHLMYRDWAEFERFSDELITAGNSLEVRVLLRKLISYIETLIQEVSKRSALQAPEPPSGQ